ncbi:SRPBCC family protein [Myxococcus sp. CA039A]|uniref:SRPBCC family protein n=1 Tax=Myxococcus sp. CA039A TaxID=2741737 RepID=UPI00157AC04F|nr:SRPBCC family protein [Myxococcus sp. CA039A]NTX54340.1 SRPBCC family protein [Myxococcus sp. CA039A]
MAKLIGIAVVVLIVGVLAFIATRPDSFHISRTRQLDASPDAVYALINNFSLWRQWSPYENVDPNMERTYEGPVEGVGASYLYKGNRNIGVGRMEILESKLGERIDIRLEFIEPFAAVNQASFVLEAVEKGTRVTWSMSGPNTFMGKAMMAFGLMESFIGKQLEKGLVDLETAARTPARKSALMETSAASPSLAH